MRIVHYLSRGKFGTNVLARQAAHLALIRSYNLDATNLGHQRFRTFPNWREARDEFEFTPIHTAALGDYSPADKECPSLDVIIEFSYDLNNLSPNTN